MKTDKKTLDLINEVKRRKAEIAKLDRPNWRTNCAWSWVDGNLSNPINLQVESNVRNLISIAGFLGERATSYQRAAEALGVEDPPQFTWNNFTVDDWIEDIRARINKVQIASKKKKLEQLENRLNAIISPELKAELELEAIAGELD